MGVFVLLFWCNKTSGFRLGPKNSEFRNTLDYTVGQIIAVDSWWSDYFNGTEYEINRIYIYIL